MKNARIPKSKITKDTLMSFYKKAYPLATTQFKRRKLFEEPDAELTYLPLRYIGRVKPDNIEYDIFESGGDFYRIPSCLTEIEMELERLHFDNRGMVVSD